MALQNFTGNSGPEPLRCIECKQQPRYFAGVHRFLRCYHCQLKYWRAAAKKGQRARARRRAAMARPAA